MKRLVVLNYTGPQATNLAVAKRLARKLQGAQRQGECVLVDCENVELNRDFLGVLVDAAEPEKIRFCGLSQGQQQFVTLCGKKGKA